MRICIDSNHFIFGITCTDPASEIFMSLLTDLEVVLPRLIIKEVCRNLTDKQINLLFSLIKRIPHFKIIDEPVPINMVYKYIKLGLLEKADAFIGEFVEWQKAKYLISDNRHFLAEFTGNAFEVLDPNEFLHRHYQMKL